MKLSPLQSVCLCGLQPKRATLPSFLKPEVSYGGPVYSLAAFSQIVHRKQSMPYAKFPLTPHACGAWHKRILGKINYFGRWGRVVNGTMTRVEGDGWKEALELYKAQADDLHV